MSCQFIGRFRFEIIIDIKITATHEEAEDWMNTSENLGSL